MKTALFDKRRLRSIRVILLRRNKRLKSLSCHTIYNTTLFVDSHTFVDSDYSIKNEEASAPHPGLVALAVISSEKFIVK